MAAYLISLERLAWLRRRRLREGLRRVASENVADGGSRAPLPGDEDVASRSKRCRLANDQAEAHASTELPKGAGVATAQELLDVPKEQIEAWLETHGGSEARILLAMLCRVASLEARLTELEGGPRGRTSLAADSLPSVTTIAPIREPVKSDVLEQVFQKNLSLRRSKTG